MQPLALWSTDCGRPTMNSTIHWHSNLLVSWIRKLPSIHFNFYTNLGRFRFFFPIGDASSSTVQIDSLKCTKYNSICQANVVLIRRLEPGRYYDFKVAVKDTRGGMTTQSCSITATNYTTPHDVIFPHKTGLIMVPEVSSTNSIDSRNSLCIVGVSIVCHSRWIAHTHRNKRSASTNIKSTAKLVDIAIIPHRLEAISQKLCIYIYYYQGNMNSCQHSRRARPHQIVRAYAITPASFSARTHVP